ncbi:MAG: ZIP family metal transporter [Chloroflexota bacterium]|nr:ZIP family metal transporter [Chloroflexota bacterium]
MLLALLLGLLTAAANIIGAALVVLQKNPSRRLLTNFIAFAGGFLVASAILGVIPEALEYGPYMPAFIALGFLLVFLGEHLFGVHLHRVPNGDGAKEALHHHTPAQRETPFMAKANVGPVALVSGAGALSALVAINIHDFMDGLGIGAAWVESASLGTLVLLAVLVHEIPAGLTVAAIALGAGASRKVAMLAGVSLALITLVAIPIPFLVGDLNPVLIGVFLSMAAGSFIYVAACLLIPTMETGGYRWSFLWVVVGFATFYAIAQLADALTSIK